MDRKSKVFHVDYARVEQIVATLSQRLSDQPIDAVVGIVRAGVVPATMFAQRLGAELFMLRCQRHAESVDWLGSPPASGQTILLVDDIVSRGETLRRAVTALEAQGYRVVTAALFVDAERATFRPDVALEAPGFIRFCWDRRETTPEARRRLAESKIEAFPPSSEKSVECFGVDMDGVLLPDLRKAHYRKDLQLTLKRRHQQKPFAPILLPDIDWRNAHIITGRPLEDYDVTRRWLDDNGFYSTKLHCRDSSLYDASTVGMLSHKIATATEIGVSTFIESELIQAVQIAEACPTVDIVWWGRKKRLRIGGISATNLSLGRLNCSNA